MPRKRAKPSVEVTDEPSSSIATVDSPATPAEVPLAERPAWVEGPAVEPPEPALTPNDGTGKNYGPPYKAIFTSAEKGFELGENRRFKQRVFTFKDKPAQDVIDKLKDHGFTYRAAEKAWTVPATAESRVLSDRLARDLAGPSQAAGRE